jgi:zinc protease
MQFLAERYLAKGVPFKLAIIPEGQQLAAVPASTAASARAARAEMAGR